MTYFPVVVITARRSALLRRGVQKAKFNSTMVAFILPMQKNYCSAATSLIESLERHCDEFVKPRIAFRIPLCSRRLEDTSFFKTYSSLSFDDGIDNINQFFLFSLLLL